MPEEKDPSAQSDELSNLDTVAFKPNEDLNATAALGSKSPDVPNVGSSSTDFKPYQKGDKIGEYTLEKILGSGSMGEVWLASDPNAEHKVALKILNQTYLKINPGFIDRFMNEIERTNKMNHPNIIRAYSGGRDNEQVYMAAEFIDGAELGDILENEKKLDEKRVLGIGRKIADGLRYAWNSFNIIHRDLKPSNIMIDKEDNPKLMDMGLSKSLFGDDSQLTVTGEILGTPNYMSPEQAAAQKNIDFRADIYGLGATLYHLATGRLPHETGDDVGIFELLKKVINEPIIPAHELNPKISRECSALLSKMTARAMEDRHGSWEEVIRDVDLVLKGNPPRGVEITNYADKGAKGGGEKSLIVPISLGIVAVLIILVIVVLAIAL